MARIVTKTPSSLPAKLGLVAFCFGLPALLAVFYLLFKGTSDGEERTVLIPRGATISSVTQTLTAEGIVEHPILFKYTLRFSGGNSKVRAGEFNFRTGMSIWSAAHTLYDGPPIVHAVTVPEGWNIRQIAEALEAAGLINRERFLKLALSQEMAKKYKLSTPHLEGFLYPDTYSFSKVDGEEKIIDKMVQSFFEVYNTRFKKMAQNTGFTMEQWVTLASIIEKETGVASERRLVASVFHNRLKKHMRLQSDPTTIYGIVGFNGNLTRKHLLTPSAYNTYTLSALPLGPIASPGMASIEAALNPADTQYLYFVSNNKGAHIFSKTYTEHVRHVANFQPRLTKRK